MPTARTTFILLVLSVSLTVLMHLVVEYVDGGQTMAVKLAMAVDPISTVVTWPLPVVSKLSEIAVTESVRIPPILIRLFFALQVFVLVAFFACSRRTIANQTTFYAAKFLSADSSGPGRMNSGQLEKFWLAFSLATIVLLLVADPRDSEFSLLPWRIHDSLLFGLSLNGLVCLFYLFTTNYLSLSRMRKQNNSSK